MKPVLYTVILTTLFSLCGCAAGSPPQSVGSEPLTRVASVDKSGLFAADNDGRMVALSLKGLTLLDFESGSNQKLSSDKPVALAWSPIDATLAAAFPLAEYETRLRLYSAQGDLLYETMLPIAHSQMTWSSSGDLLVTGYNLKVYSFGGSLRQFLYRVDTQQTVETVLSDTTLKPATVKLLTPAMQKVLPVAFSSFGDELVYVHIHDPPEFLPYLQLIYRSWLADENRMLEKMPLQALNLSFDQSGTFLSFFTERSIDKLELWPGSKENSGAKYSFVKGRLFDSDDLLADWGDAAHWQLLSGGRFLLAVQNSLYLGDGLQAEVNESDSEKKRSLRRWRFEGLITPEEYQRILWENSP